MNSLVEYLFAADIRLADEAARRHGWRVYGRLGWMKPDGVEVHFICLEEQLSVVGENVTIYFVGDLSERFRRFKEVNQTPQVIWTRYMPPRPRISMGLTHRATFGAVTLCGVRRAASWRVEDLLGKPLGRRG